VTIDYTAYNTLPLNTSGYNVVRGIFLSTLSYTTLHCEQRYIINTQGKEKYLNVSIKNTCV